MNAAVFSKAIATTVVVAAGLAVLGGLAVGARGSGHSAETVILVTPLQGNPFSPDRGDDLVNMETEARLVTSDAVATLVAADLGADPGAPVLRGVEVKVPANTQLVQITVTDADRAEARNRAAAFADAYLAYRQARSQEVVRQRQAHLDEQSSATEAEIATVTRQLSRTQPGSARAQVLQAQITDAAGRLSQVRTEVAGLGAASRDPGQVVTPAAVDPEGPLSGWRLGAVAGAFLGLLGSLVWFVVRLRRGGRITAPSDAEALGLPVLDDATAGARARLLAGAPTGRTCVALVQAADAGDDGAPGDPWAGLADSFARARYRTVRVRTDVPGPGPGLLEVLRGEEPLDAVLVRPSDDHAAAGFGAPVELLAGSPRTDHEVADLVASSAMTDLVTELRRHADVVLLEGAVASSALAQALVQAADQTVLLLRPGTSRARHVTDLTDLADRSGTRVVGALWHVDDPSAESAAEAHLATLTVTRDDQHPRRARVGVGPNRIDGARP